MPAPYLDDISPALLINGAWTPASTQQTFAVQDPATGDVLADVANADATDARRAMDAAADAQPAWAATPPRRRSEILRRAWELLQARRDEFAHIIVREMGKPLAEAYSEVDYGGEFLRWFAEEAVRISGRYGSNPEGTGHTIVSRRPVGPAYLITPWNFPLAMATRKIAPAMAAGCTSILKPAELTPLTSLKFGQLLLDAGTPRGVVNILTTDRPADISRELLADRRLRKISFTGSTAVGQTLLRQASDNVLRTSMELGGNAPFLVFADADLDAAVQGALIAKFRNIGQACTAANRFIVDASVADEFTARLAAAVAGLRVGAGTQTNVQIGPLIDARAVSHNEDLVRDAVDRGADLLVGGARIEGPGNFFAPSVLAHVPVHARLMREEIFGPVLAVATFTEEPEAIRLANSTEYGLVAYAYTRDLARAHRLIDELDTGMLGINVGAISNAAAPFGGTKHSGLGREGGVEGISEYLDTKYTLIPA